MDVAFSRAYPTCGHFANQRSSAWLRAPEFARLHFGAAQTLTRWVCKRIGVFAPPAKPTFSRLIKKNGKLPKLQLKKAALDTADATPPYSPRQRPVQAAGRCAKPVLHLRRLLSYRICHLSLFS
jgi:hypothetical protein